MESKKFEKAKTVFKDIIEYRKCYAEAHTALGVCHYNLGNTEESIVCLKKSIELQPNLTLAHISLYRIETQKNRSSSADFGEYWTKSGTRIGVLVVLVAIAVATMIHSVYIPDTNYTKDTTTNYTRMQGTSKQDVNETISTSNNSNLNQLRLAVIIGIVVVILWPSIKTIKVGTSSLEVEKLTDVEVKEQIFLSWIPEQQVFGRGRIF